MAFNLNKNEESASNAGFSKSSTSKFDLSKGDNPSGVDKEKSNKSKTWLWALLGVLLLGGGAWYFLSNNNSNSNSTASNDSIPSTVESKANTSTTQPNDQNKVPTPIINSPKSPSTSTENTTTQNGTSIDKNSVTSTEEVVGNNKTTTSPNNKANNTSSNVSGSTLNNKVPASFSKASASLNNIDKSVVKEIISFLEKNPNAVVGVNGYASSEGTLDVNQKISQLRADVFKKYLISKGISDKRIIATGKGIDNPVASNDTEEGRKKNRRIEIALQ